MNHLLYSFILVALASQALAQTNDPNAELKNDTQPSHPYLGIQPGSRDVAPGKEQVSRNGNFAYITWIGFQASHPGGRVFIQGNEPLTYHVISGNSDTVIIEVEDAKLQYRNDGRAIDTRAFETAVNFIETTVKRRNTVQIAIKMRQATPYQLHQEGNYIFVDFAPVQSPAQ